MSMAVESDVTWHSFELMSAMDLPMATAAECDQVFLNIGTELTAAPEVVHLQIAIRAATLAAPAIPLEHGANKPTIGFLVELNPRTLGS